MTKNELRPGEPRLGWFVDGNPDTESIAVMLRNTGAEIELTVPFHGRLSIKDDPYSRWWSGGVHFGDDPDRTRYSYTPPRQLQVEDADGPVVLVGCRSTGSKTNFAVGYGRLVANFAILGTRSLDYDRINGLRTDIPALAAWTRLSTMEVQKWADEHHRAESVRMELTRPEPISLARPLNLVMRSRWRVEEPPGSFHAYEAVNLETRVRQVRDWNEHLTVHGAVLQLVSIAGWEPFGITSTTVLREDDPRRTVGGDNMGERWLQVVTHRLPEHTPWTKEPRFLFPWSDVGPGGVKRWLGLQKRYGRVVGPLLNILRSDDPWGDPSLVQSGIALEALAYLVDIEKNDSAHLNGRGQMKFKDGLQIILDDMNMKPFDDVSEWIDRAHAAYMGAKHPDRPEPDSLDMVNALRENILILRCWIGLEIGVPPEILKSALRTDPLAAEFTIVE